MVPTSPTRQSHTQFTLTIRMNPKLSGYAQHRWVFNYNATPLAPPGTQVIIHEKPTVRVTWSSYGVKWWYLGPSMNHYQCHHAYVTKKRGERDSYFVEFSHIILHSPTLLPRKMSSSRRMNYPMPWRTQHPKRHFPTLATPKWLQVNDSPRSFPRWQIMWRKEQTIHNSKQWKNPPLYLRNCVQIGPNLFPQYSPIS